MSKPRWMAGLVLVAGLGVAVTGVHVTRETKGAQAARDAARKAGRSAELRLGDLRAQADAAEQRATEAAKVNAVREPERAGSSEREGSGGRLGAGANADTEGGRERVTLREALRRWQEENKRPDIQMRIFARQRERHAENFRAFHRAQRMDEATARRFDAAYAKRDEREWDLNAATREVGLPFDDSAVVKLRGEIYSEHDRAVREILGEDDYAALKEYRRTVGLRDAVKDMSATATMAGVPLAPAQIEQLLGLIASEAPAYLRGQAVGPLGVNWEGVIKNLPNILSPEQVSAVTSESFGGLMHAWWNAEAAKAAKAAPAR